MRDYADISGYLRTEQFVLDELSYHLARSLGPQPGGSLPTLRSYALKSIDTTTKTYAASYNDTEPDLQNRLLM